MKRCTFFSTAVVVALLHGAAYGQRATPTGLVLTPSVRVTFASVEEGRALASTRDDYSERTSILERQLKVRTTRALSEADYLQELASDVREWSEAERTRVTRAIESLRKPLAELPLPLPSRVMLVLMSGRVNGPMVAYTRGPAIYLPHGVLNGEGPSEALPYLLSHELFHVASRQDRSWREKMYATVGFRLLAEVTLPPALQIRRITNPDAPRLDSAIRVNVPERGAVWVVPLLQATIDRLEKEPQAPQKEPPEHFMQVMQLKWLEVGRGDTLPVQPAPEDPAVLHDTRALQGFIEAIGRNTAYVIHAEEILADNFSQLVLGRAPRSPEIHRRMREVMSETARASAAPANPTVR